MEAARTSETLVNFYQTTRRYNPEDSIFVLTAVRTSNPTIDLILERTRYKSQPGYWLYWQILRVFPVSPGEYLQMGCGRLLLNPSCLTFTTVFPSHVTLLLSRLHSCFVCAKPWIQILARRPATLTEVFRRFPQSLHTNSGIVPKLTPRQLPSISFPIHCSLIILLFGAVYSDLLAASLNKSQTGKTYDIT
jgi:hypothetical protein